MIPTLRLTTRTFLLSFLPLSAALACGFLATRLVVKERLKRTSAITLSGRKQAAKDSDEYDQRNRRLVGIPSEPPRPKAAIGLLRESSSRQEIQRTIEGSCGNSRYPGL
jgi:hypothetical protein